MDNLTQETVGEIFVLRFVKSAVVDSTTVESLSQGLIDRMSVSGCSKVILDFTGVALMTSEIIGSLVGFRMYCESRGISLKLSGLSEEIGHLLKITRLDCQFKTYHSLKSAMERFDADGYLMRQAFFSTYLRRSADEFDHIVNPEAPQLVEESGALVGLGSF